MNVRELNILIAKIFVALSLPVLCAAVYFFYASSVYVGGKSKDILAAQCVKEFEAIGVKANIRPEDHAIVSYQSRADSVQDGLRASSLVIGRCAGYRLAEFCAGGGCPKPGVFFVLETF